MQQAIQVHQANTGEVPNISVMSTAHTKDNINPSIHTVSSEKQRALGDSVFVEQLHQRKCMIITKTTRTHLSSNCSLITQPLTNDKSGSWNVAINREIYSYVS